jgi:Bacterial PH domain
MAIWDPEITLELDEGEYVIAMCRHHWLMLLVEEIPPLLVAVIAGGAAAFRAAGGGFFGSDPGMAQQIDLVNMVLIGVLAVLLGIWVREMDVLAKKKSKQKPPIDVSWVLQIGILLVLVLIWYRYQGGRVIDINPERAAPFDLINIVLMVISGLAVLAMGYIALDWRDDALILTNTRIVLDKEEFLVRHVQQQILLIDVQQVAMRQNTYPQVIFGYGALTIQSFSLKKINFDFATRPQFMESCIKQELTKIRRSVEPNLVKRLIEERVFDEKKQRALSAKKFYVETKGANRTGVLAWLFPANPQIDEKSGQIIWRPSSVYVALQLLKPFGIWLAFTLGLAAVASFIPELLWIGVIVWLVATLVCGAWIFWLREEFVEDVYILNKREIIDVDRRPFGPVNRRSAPIDRIQNISFDVSFIEQILGFGTVKVQTGGSGDFSFNHVPDPRGVQAMINDYLTDFKRSAEERNMQNSIDVFREYHSLQREKGELMDPEQIARAMDDRAISAVESYATQIAPVQIALQIRQALRAQSRAERRDRVRKLIARRRLPGDDSTAT